MHCSLIRLVVFALSIGPVYGANLLRYLVPRHELQVITVTDTTPHGALWRPVSTAAPAFYAAMSSGYRDLGGVVAGVKVPAKENVYRVMARALATRGYLPMTDQHSPSILLSWTWGTLNRNYAIGENGTGPQANMRQLLRFMGADKLGILSKQGGAVDGLIPDPIAFGAAVDAIREAAQTDLYVIAIIAYDYAAFTRRHEIKPLWITRISCPSIGHSLPNALPAMLTLAAKHIGRETSMPVWEKADENLKAEVEIGELRVVENQEPANLPVVETANLDPILNLNPTKKAPAPKKAKR